MREWLFGLVPVGLVVYFVLNPAHFSLLLLQAKAFLH